MAAGEPVLQSFPPTNWSLVRQAGSADPQVKRQALSQLLQIYRPALLKYLVVSKRLNLDLAEDIVQDFITRKVLERDLVAQAEQAKGKLRSFLVKCLQNYAWDMLRGDERVPRSRHEHAVSSSGEDEFSFIDGLDGSASTEQNLLDQLWAREALQESLARMQAQCARTAQLARQWEVFDACVVGPALTGATRPSSEDLAEKYRLDRPEQVNAIAVNGKRRFKNVLEALIREYAVTDAEVEAEIDELRLACASLRAVSDETDL